MLRVSLVLGGGTFIVLKIPASLSACLFLFIVCLPQLHPCATGLADFQALAACLTRHLGAWPGLLAAVSTGGSGSSSSSVAATICCSSASSAASCFCSACFFLARFLTFCCKARSCLTVLTSILPGGGFSQTGIWSLKVNAVYFLCTNQASLSLTGLS